MYAALPAAEKVDLYQGTTLVNIIHLTQTAIPAKMIAMTGQPSPQHSHISKF
jgi:hypothetical protein